MLCPLLAAVAFTVWLHHWSVRWSRWTMVMQAVLVPLSRRLSLDKQASHEA